MRSQAIKFSGYSGITGFRLSKPESLAPEGAMITRGSSRAYATSYFKTLPHNTCNLRLPRILRGHSTVFHAAQTLALSNMQAEDALSLETGP